jgi:hypothetical protein
MSEETEQEQQESEEITLSIDWHFPEGLQSRYANNVLVQAGRYELVISFFEVQMPLLAASPEENKAKLQQMGSVQADCVSKIVVPPDLVQGLINALQTELDKFSSQKSR